MKGKRIILSLLCLSGLLFGENEEEMQNLMNQTFIDMAKPENIKKFKEMRDNKNLVEEEFLNFNQIEISSTPEKLKLNDTNFISIHPEMPKTVIYKNIKITDLTAYPLGSISATIDENNLNSLEIKTANSLKKGVIVVKYLDKNNQKRLSNLLVESYDTRRDKKIYLTTEITDFSQLKPLEIIKKYQKLYSSNPVNNSSIVIDNEVYRFIEDSINGFVTIGNKKFRIEHNFK